MHCGKSSGLSLAACVLLLAILTSGLLQEASGQVATGTVRGTVQYEDGRPLSGVWVIIQHDEIGVNYKKDSNPRGQFVFEDLYPGPYSFTISPGQFIIRSPKQIQVREGRVMDVTVVVARTARSTELDASADGAGAAEATPPANPASASNQISENLLVGLPLNGRSYTQLATLESGVADPVGGSAQRGGGSGSLTVSGGRSSSNSFLMDGTNIMDTGNQVPRSAAGVQLGSDTILEVQVNGVQYGAEYGRGSGGVLNSITRSGTDEFHANVFEFFRNSKLDARNFFDRRQNPTDPRLPPFKRNQFGFTATAPLVKGRTYVMGGLEVMRDRLTFTDTSNVVDPERVTDALQPGQTVEPEVQRLLAYYVPANQGFAEGGFGQNSSQIFLPTNETFFTIRLDHRLTERDSFFARYNFDDATSMSAQTLPSLFRTLNQSRQQYVTLVGSHILSPRTIATLRLGYTRPVSARETVNEIEIPRELFFVPSAPAFGQIQLAGASAFGPTPSLPEAEIMNTFQYAGDLILQRGKHNLKAGGEVHRYRWDVFTSTNQGGSWSFTSLENFLTLERGLPEGSSGTTSLSVALPGSDGFKAYRQTLVGMYVQDEYRVVQRLQLNLGLRYEFATMIHDREGRTAYLADPLHDTQMQIGPYVKDNPSLRNFSPRVGLTWALTGSAATVLSAGFGIYYDQMLEYVVDSRVVSQPFYRSVFIPNLRPYRLFPDALAAAAGRGSASQALILDYENFNTPMVLRYSASVRQQLLGNWRAQVSYVGARANHLYRAYEINQLPFPYQRADGTWYFPPGTNPRNPAFGSINLLASDAQSFYNALQISMNKSFGRGTTVQANYTFSKSIDDSSNFNANNEGIQYGPLRHVDRAVSDYDIRNRLTTSFFYTLPFGGQGTWWKTGVAGHILGGWRIGGILSARTGTPINLRMNVRDSNFLFAPRRPNLKPGRSGNAIHGVTEGCLGMPAGIPLGTPHRYYDPCAFSVPEAGTLGNNGRNTLKGPGSFAMDVSLQREFLLDSKRRIQFRAEAFNLTNRANFRPFVAGSGIVFQGSSTQPRLNPISGRFVNTTTTARQIQFALRLSF